MNGKNKNNQPEYYPSAMTIAGSDSGGGAGIQADLRTFNALGVFGCSVITAVTSQNPAAVSRIDTIPAAGVTAQIEAVLDKIAVRWVKTGMPGSAENVSAVAEAIKAHKLKVVCDPVMISTSGTVLGDEASAEMMQKELMPRCAWITPNIPESEFILKKKFSGPADIADGAKALADRFQTNIVLKGGHDESSSKAVDYVCFKGEVFTLSAPRLKIPPFASHGTGCTFSAAMAALSALKFQWSDMLQEAKAFVFGSLRENVEIGDNVFGMYPPVEDSLELIDMAEFSNKPRKGKHK